MGFIPSSELGGKPVRTKGYQSWPMVGAADEKSVLEVVRAGRWYRSRSVDEFEETFAKALRAEGIPCSTGYGRLNEASFIQDTLHSRPYVKVYGKATIEKWAERNRCPEKDKLCEEAVWLMQNIFLGPRSAIDEIAEAIRKTRARAPARVRA